MIKFKTYDVFIRDSVSVIDECGKILMTGFLKQYTRSSVVNRNEALLYKGNSNQIIRVSTSNYKEVILHQCRMVIFEKKF